MLLKLATTLLAATTIAQADQSAQPDTAERITVDAVNLAAEGNPKRRVSGSIRAATSSKIDAECSFVEMLPGIAAEADADVVKCARSEWCVEDETSSLGGRCVLKDDAAGSLVGYLESISDSKKSVRSDAGISNRSLVSKAMQRKVMSVVEGSEVKLTASDGAASDYFGWNLSVSGDTVVVGAPYDGDKGSYSGSVYIYEKHVTSGAWSEVTKLTASDGAASDYFGYRVSVSGDTVVVGAHGDDDKGTDSGSAYIFEKNVTSGAWDQVAKLTASDGATADSFGLPVSVSGDTVVVGAYGDDDKGDGSGSAYIFEKNVTSGAWDQVAKLTASDGAAADYFGFAVSVSGDTVVVGAFQDDDKGTSSGAAYIYEKNVTSSAWEQVAKLSPSDGAMYDSFGRDVSISGEVAIFGAPYDDGKGSAYIYEKNVTSAAWALVAKLTASDGAADDRFGYRVSVSGNVAIVGAYQDDDKGTSSGAAYIFAKDGLDGPWAQVTKLTASDGAAYDQFARAVSVSGDTVVVGAFGDDDKGDYTGSAYIYDLLLPTTGPTTSPSTSPTKNPSSSPSKPPSVSPTASPTTTSSPSRSPSSSPSASAVTNPASPTNEAEYSPGSGTKFYADWLSGDMTCKNDGDAPQYMVSNAAVWLFEDIETCCAKFFGYELNTCLGESYAGSGKYYPDWLGANEGCLEDVQASLAPSYMMQSGAFLYTTLDECCERHYNYRVNACKGVSSVGSNKWFINWKTYKCVKDCDVADGADCGGRADGFWDLLWTFTTKEECCRTRVSWNFHECMA